MSLVPNEAGKAMFDELIELYRHQQITIEEIAQKIQLIPPGGGGGGSTGGLSFMKISEEDYKALDPKDPDTVYYVYDDKGRYKQYIGGQGIEMLAITAGGIIPKMSTNPGFSMIQGTIEEGT